MLIPTRCCPSAEIRLYRRNLVDLPKKMFVKLTILKYLKYQNIFNNRFKCLHALIAVIFNRLTLDDVN